MSRNIWWGLILAGLFLFFYRVRLILTPFLFAIVIAYLLYPLIISFEGRGVSRVISILLAYALFAVFLGVLFWVFLPRLAQELEDILKKLPSQTEYWENRGQDAFRSLRQIQLAATLQQALNILLERVELALEELASRVAQVLLGVFTHLVSLFISPILAFYFLKDHQVMRERTLQYVPAAYRGEVLSVVGKINAALNGFFRGQVLVSLLVGLLIYGGLALLGLPYALFIGFLAGVFDLIPYFGPVLGFIPAAGLALLKSPTTVLWVLLLFVGANQLESSIISPKVIGDRVGLHPLVVIFAVLVGGDLMGLGGLLLAIPTAAIIRVLLQHFLRA